MQVTIGLGVLASLLLGCSGGVLNVGSNDAGRRGDEEVAIAGATQACALLRTDLGTFNAVRLDSVNWATYAPAELRSDLSGEWNVCTFMDTGVHIRSFRFTADGHWTILFDDGDGGVTRSPVGSQAPIIPGYDAGAAGYEGTYVPLGNDGQPPSPDGGLVSLVSASSTSTFWFRPTFTTVMGEPVMAMTFSNSPQVICVFVGP